MTKQRRRKIWAGDPGCQDADRKANFRKKTTPGGFDVPVSKKDMVAVPRKLRELQKRMNADQRRQAQDIQNKRKQAGDSKAAESAKKRRKKNKQSDGEIVLKPGDAYKFETTMREGESFQAYSRRIGREKRKVMVAQAQSLRKMPEKRKQFLDQRKQERKAKTIGEKRNDSSDDEETFRTSDERPAHLRNRATRFQGKEVIQFGDIADAPPAISVFPKKKQEGMGELATFLKRKAEEAALNGDEDEVEESEGEREEREEREYEMAKQRETERIRERALALMRAKSQSAYKDYKVKRKEVEKMEYAAKGAAGRTGRGGNKRKFPASDDLWARSKMHEEF